MTSLIACGLALLSYAADSPQDVYEKANQQLREAQTLSGSYDLIYNENVMSGTFKLAKPNYYIVSNDGVEERSDGKTLWTYLLDRNQYLTRDMEEGMAVSVPTLRILQPFFGKVSGFELQKVDMSEWRNKEVVTAHFNFPGRDEYSVEFHYDPKTACPLGLTETYQKNRADYVIKDLTYNPEIAMSEFDWSPPADAKLYEQPDFGANLLAVGTEAPNFTLQTETGQSISLKDALKGKKALLINFWFYH